MKKYAFKNTPFNGCEIFWGSFLLHQPPIIWYTYVRWYCFALSLFHFCFYSVSFLFGSFLSCHRQTSPLRQILLLMRFFSSSTFAFVWFSWGSGNGIYGISTFVYYVCKYIFSPHFITSLQFGAIKIRSQIQSLILPPTTQHSTHSLSLQLSTICIQISLSSGGFYYFLPFLSLSVVLLISSHSWLVLTTRKKNMYWLTYDPHNGEMDVRSHSLRNSILVL